MSNYFEKVFDEGSILKIVEDYDLGKFEIHLRKDDVYSFLIDELEFIHNNYKYSLEDFGVNCYEKEFVLFYSFFKEEIK